MDFDHYMQHVQPYNPFYQKWAGVGYVPKFQEGIVANGAKANLEMAWMTSERHKGRAVHVPPFYPGTNQREADKAMAELADAVASELPGGYGHRRADDRHTGGIGICHHRRRRHRRLR